LTIGLDQSFAAQEVRNRISAATELVLDELQRTPQLFLRQRLGWCLLVVGVLRRQPRRRFGTFSGGQPGGVAAGGQWMGVGRGKVGVLGDREQVGECVGYGDRAQVGPPGKAFGAVTGAQLLDLCILPRYPTAPAAGIDANVSAKSASISASSSSATSHPQGLMCGLDHSTVAKVLKSCARSSTPSSSA
jgi:hypothetical protein